MHLDNFPLFKNRQDAGKKLIPPLATYKNDKNTIILALPRGGVVVAYEVAQLLSLPLDIFIVRKLGVPGHEELAMGAIAPQNIVLLNQEVITQYNISPDEIESIKTKELLELKRREKVYRQGTPFPILTKKNIILIDDGVATGATMMAAIEALKKFSPQKIIVAVPVGAKETIETLQQLVKKVICLHQPEPFFGIGLFYADFAQTTDAEVCQLLERLKSNDNR